MTWLEPLAQPMWRNLVFALLHTLWQGALLGLLLSLALRWIPARRHNARYLLALAAQLGVLLAGLTTWGVLNLDRTHEHAGSVLAGHSSPLAPQVDSQLAQRVDDTRDLAAALQSSAPQSDAPAIWVSWAAMAWVLGVCLMLVRTGLSVARARRLAHGPELSDQRLLVELEQLRGNLRIRRPIRAVVSDACGTPAVLGIIWPAVVLPVSMLTGLSPQSARAILAHELAHIRRYDYLLNLVQMLIEAVLFFNPAVWWIGRQVRNEREACCDALAVAITGEPVDYTRALADWAERVPGGMVPAAAAAWPGNGERKTLLDRVRRILLPGYRPDVQVSWSGLIGLLVLGPLLLAGLWQGTTAAVALAAEILSPAERIEKLESVQERYGKPTESTEEPKGKFTISGRIRMADGSPLPPKTHSDATLLRPGYSGGYSLDLDSVGRFTKEFEVGTVYLHVHPPDHAIAIAGPFTARPGETIEDVELMVSRGFSAQIRFVNTRGEPVPGVLLEEMDYRMPRDAGSWSGYSHPQEGEDLQSDERGVVTLERCSDWPVHIDVRGSGYQFERRELKLEAGPAATWELKPARATTGIVISKETGRAISSARLFLAQRAGYENASQDPRQWTDKPLLAISDEQGRFRLDTLRDDSQYMIHVAADGHGVELVRDVRAGQENLTIRLGPPLYIRGRVIGNLDELPRDYQTRKPYIRYRNPIRMLDASGTYSALFRATLDVRDGEGTFEIRDLFPGFAQVNASGRELRFDLQEPIEDVTIDLTKPQEDAALENRPKRSIVLRFDIPPGGVPPRGKLRVGYVLADDLGTHGFKDKIIDLIDREVHFEAPVGSGFFYDGRQLIGYWIEDRSDIQVVEGDLPLEISIPVVPAGAVYGRVLNPDGSPAEACTVHTITVEKPEAPGFHFVNVTVRPSDGRFVVSPIPLGGRYRFLADEHGSQARQLSEILVLHEKQPLHEIELRLAEGVPLRGRVLAPDRSPVPGARVSFGYSSEGHSFGDADVMTDGQGRFLFERVNPDIPGRYSLAVRPTETLRGQNIHVEDPRKEILVRMRAGEHLRGVLLDADNSEPIGDAKVAAWIADFRNVEYGGPLETLSDPQGRFAFQNLEPTLYRLKVDGGEVVRIDPEHAESQRSGEPVIRAGEQSEIRVFVRRSQQP